MKNLFAKIAYKYDAMNRIMSIGLDRMWRRAAIRNINIPDGCRILDLACGTGDFTMDLATRWPNASISGVDLTPEMIDIACEKLTGFNNVTFIAGDAHNLFMFEPKGFSLIVCAFGFRNFLDKAKVLSECNRILADGGRLVVLELFRPTSYILGMAVNAWLAVVSWLFASRAYSEYRYLRKSVSGTVSAEEFMHLAKENGFSATGKTFMPPAATCISLTKASLEER